MPASTTSLYKALRLWKFKLNENEHVHIDNKQL